MREGLLKKVSPGRWRYRHLNGTEYVIIRDGKDYLYRLQDPDYDNYTRSCTLQGACDEIDAIEASPALKRKMQGAP
jgi:hypothetical protein